MSDIDLAPTSEISWLRLPAAVPVPEEKAALATTIEMVGYIRHQQNVSAHRPGILTALGALASTILRGESDLSLQERELVALVVSSENRCDACVIAHTAALRSLGGSAQWADEIAVNYRRATLTERERALSDYAVKVTRAANEVEEADLEPMRAAGISEQGIIDAAAVISLFNFTNRFNSGLGVKVNSEAHESYR